jgi:hypothetical protein
MSTSVQRRGVDLNGRATTRVRGLAPWHPQRPTRASYSNWCGWC